MSRSLRVLSPSKEEKKKQNKGEKKVYLTKIGKDFDWCLDLCFEVKGDICHVKRERVSTQCCLAYNLFMDFVTIKEKTLPLNSLPYRSSSQGLSNSCSQKADKQKNTDYTFEHNYGLASFFVIAHEKAALQLFIFLVCDDSHIQSTNVPWQCLVCQRTDYHA